MSTEREGTAGQFQALATAELARMAGGADWNHHVCHLRPVAALLSLGLQRIYQGQHCVHAIAAMSGCMLTERWGERERRGTYGAS